MGASSRHRWLDRLLGAGVGIAAAALWFVASRDEAKVADESAARSQASTDERPGDAVPPLVTLTRSPGDLSSATAATTPTSGRAVDGASAEHVAAAGLGFAEEHSAPSLDTDHGEVPSPAPPSDPSSTPADIASGHAQVAPDPRDETAIEAATAPVLTLPRMPGDTKLSTSARWDAASSSWVLKGAYRVHARSHHVIGFYRKALLDQGLSVSMAEDPPTPQGAVKTYLRGKSSRVHAQVGIMPRTDSLETRVWILWRTRS